MDGWVRNDEWRTMPRVIVEPSGIEIDVEPDETVAEAAWRQGLVWPTKCWGQLDCMACFTTIVDEELSAVPAEDEELDAMRLRLPARSRDPLVRLGCRLKVKKSGLVVEKSGVRPKDSSTESDEPKVVEKR